MTDRELMSRAKDAAGYSYSPYSRFAVGAALECDDGTVYTGCNVENAALGSTICAERTACCKAVSEGHRKFLRIAIYGEGENYCMVKTLKEFRLDNADQLNVGDVLKADVFATGDKVDVTGISKGHGYQGVVKRWNAQRTPTSHGGGPVHRHLGSMPRAQGRMYRINKRSSHITIVVAEKE